MKGPSTRDFFTGILRLSGHTGLRQHPEWRALVGDAKKAALMFEIEAGNVSGKTFNAVRAILDAAANQKGKC